MSDAIVTQLQALLPPVSYEPTALKLVAQITTDAKILSDAVANLEAVEAAIFPASSGEYISDWERIYGITPSLGASQQSRIDAVLVAQSDRGGQSTPYFVRIASLFSVTANIETFRLPVMGRVSAGDPVYSGDWPYFWRLNAPLSASTNPPMQTLITERRPANTEVIFGYGQEVIDVVTDAVDQLFNAVHYVLPYQMSTANE